MQQESQIRAFAPPSLVPRHVPPESPKAARAYAHYELLGDGRTLPNLIEWYMKQPEATKNNQKSKKYIPNLSTLKRWSSDYNWQQRIADYERQQLEERRKKRQAEIDKMDEEHALIGRGNLLRAVEIVRRHIDTQDTTLASAVSLLKASYVLERLARGAATERFEGDVDVTILPKMYINVDPSEEGSEL
jgi:hypothetical protein